MGIKTGRAEGVAAVIIDREQCTVCGMCVKVCRGGPLYLDNGQVRVDQARGFGCIACGQCVAVCPQACIFVDGRDLTPEDALPLPQREARSSYDQLRALLLARRSIRDFEDRPVERAVIDQILEAASTAPMGIPPTDVGVLVLDGKAKVKAFKDDLLAAMKGMISPWMRVLWLPFMGKDLRELFKAFVIPVVRTYLEKDAQGADWFFYDAPLAMFFYSAVNGDPADPVIAATYAMLAAESLGLGSCMLGFPGPVLKNGKALRLKYRLPIKMTPGIAIIFGYPDAHYRRTLRRRFARVDYA